MRNLLAVRPSEFKPDLNTRSHNETQIVIVGCGGTGGRLIPVIAQHIANHNNDVINNPSSREYLKGQLKLLLVDGDVVEAKNLKRQNFFSFDVSKYKAECLAERYSALYGINIEFFNGIFSECDFALGRNDHGLHNKNLIIFDCTDNSNARRSIEAYKKYAVLISCGNEDSFGQVLVSTIKESKMNTIKDQILALNSAIKMDTEGEIDFSKRAFHKTNFLPTLLDLFPNFKDTEKPSCTEMVLQNDQSMPINSLVAQLAYNAFYDIISGKGLNYWMVRCNVNNTFSTEYISNPFLLKNLYAQSVFGFSDDTAIELLDKMSLKRLHTYSTNDEINSLAFDPIYEYGVLKYIYSFMYYAPQGDALKRIEEAKERVIKYINGE